MARKTFSLADLQKTFADAPNFDSKSTDFGHITCTDQSDHHTNFDIVFNEDASSDREELAFNLPLPDTQMWIPSEITLNGNVAHSGLDLTHKVQNQFNGIAMTDDDGQVHRTDVRGLRIETRGAIESDIMVETIFLLAQQLLALKPQLAHYKCIDTREEAE